MSFEAVEQQTVWCIHFWTMSLCKGIVLGKENGSLYVRMDGNALTNIQFINNKNVFYSEEAGNKALFKANLAGQKRKSNENIK